MSQPHEPKKPKHFFKLFANCIPVKGAARGVICDLQRNDVTPVPNDLCDILIEFDNKSVMEIQAAYDPSVHDTLAQYFRFLEEKEYGFWTDEPFSFPPLDLAWKSPYTITNAIIDVDEHSCHPYPRIISQLSDLGCLGVQLRFYCPMPLDRLDEILVLTQGTRLRFVELVIPYSPALSEETVIDFSRAHLILSHIIINNAPITKNVENRFCKTIYTTQAITSHQHCGVIAPAYFSINLETFTEAQHHDTCLNRKIAIDIDGSIKNCPSMPRSFGNIEDTLLKDVLEIPEFKAPWFTSKDKIDECKDCEFRYICTGCRAFLKDPGNPLSKPLKCTYNPFTLKYEPTDTQDKGDDGG